MPLSRLGSTPSRKTPGVAANFEYRGRLYVRGFLRLGSTKPLLPPTTTVKMGVHRVHVQTDTPRVSHAPTTSTQRRHGHIDRVDRGGRLRELTPLAFAPATTVSAPRHDACGDRGGRGRFGRAGLSRELRAADAETSDDSIMRLVLLDPVMAACFQP